MAVSLSKSIQRLFYIIWLPMPGLLGLLLSGHSGLSVGGWWLFAIISGGLYAPMAASSYYVCKGVPLRRHRRKEVFAAFALASSLLSSVWTGLGLLALSFLAAPSLVYPTIGVLLFFFGIVGVGFGCTYYYAMLAIEGAESAVQQAKEAEWMAREAELRALRAQIRPHFLFNSLNAISALTTLDAKRARKMCVALADFLRATLQTSEQEIHSLNQEVELLRSYLLIERERLGERLQVQIDVDARLEEQIVLPTLLLQPLVENAIKHSASLHAESAYISVVVRAADTDIVTVNISNNRAEGETKTLQRRGVGLRLTRERLHAHYGAQGSLQFKQSPTTTQVTLCFPRQIRDANE